MEVMGRILREARGLDREKGKGRMVNGDGGRREVDVRVPEKMVREGVRVVREALDKVVEIEREEEEE